MIMNIVVSTSLVFKYHLVGVAIGTLVAMLYHTIYFAWYLRKNIINRPFHHFVKHMVIDILVGILGFIATSGLTMSSVTYIAWIVYAVQVSRIVAAITLILNLLVYKNEFRYILRKVMKKA